MGDCERHADPRAGSHAKSSWPNLLSEEAGTQRYHDPVDPSVELQLESLSDGLEAELCCDQVVKLIDIVKSIVERTDAPLQRAGYTVESVLGDLYEFWDRTGVSPAAHHEVNAKLGPALRRVVAAMSNPQAWDELPGLEGELVACFVGLQLNQMIR